jgi:TetR/AcrR family transcriptional repressor of mexJK operon
MARRGRPPKQQENGDKRTEVLEVATRYFLAHGYDGASINAMARDSGISKESIYRYFRSKDDLFKAVIEQELSLYQQRLEAATDLDTHADLETALLDTAENLLLTVMSDRTLALRRLVFQVSLRSPDVGALYYRIGPTAAYERLEALFAQYGLNYRISGMSLARHFTAMLLHAFSLQRDCGLRPAPTVRTARKYGREVVSDFLRAFGPVGKSS